MKTLVSLLSAAALVFAASATHATDPESQRYADRAKADAQSLLRTSPVELLNGQSVTVRAKVDIDGRVLSTQVVRSSGSRGADLAAESFLKKVVVRNPLLGLTDGAVLMTLNGAPIVEAAAR